MKEYTPENIHEFFDELKSKPNAELRQLMVYCGYARDRERQKRVVDIQADCGPWGNPCPTIIGEDMAVVKLTNICGASEVYSAFLNGKMSNYCYETFDEAILALVCWKRTGNEEAVKWMWRMIKEGESERV